jgi:hypothetical protein
MSGTTMPARSVLDEAVNTATRIFTFDNSSKQMASYSAFMAAAVVRALRHLIWLS